MSATDDVAVSLFEFLDNHLINNARQAHTMIKCLFFPFFLVYKKKKEEGRWQGERGQGRRLEAARARGAAGWGEIEVAAPRVVALNEGPQERPGAHGRETLPPAQRGDVWLPGAASPALRPESESSRAEWQSPGRVPPLHLGLAL